MSSLLLVFDKIEELEVKGIDISISDSIEYDDYLIEEGTGIQVDYTEITKIEHDRVVGFHFSDFTLISEETQEILNDVIVYGNYSNLFSIDNITTNKDANLNSALFVEDDTNNWELDISVYQITQ